MHFKIPDLIKDTCRKRTVFFGRKKYSCGKNIESTYGTAQ